MLLTDRPRQSGSSTPLPPAPTPGQSLGTQSLHFPAPPTGARPEPGRLSCPFPGQNGNRNPRSERRAQVAFPPKDGQRGRRPPASPGPQAGGRKGMSARGDSEKGGACIGRQPKSRPPRRRSCGRRGRFPAPASSYSRGPRSGVREDSKGRWGSGGTFDPRAAVAGAECPRGARTLKSTHPARPGTWLAVSRPPAAQTPTPQAPHWTAWVRALGLGQTPSGARGVGGFGEVNHQIIKSGAHTPHPTPAAVSPAPPFPAPEHGLRRPRTQIGARANVPPPPFAYGNPGFKTKGGKKRHREILRSGLGLIDY
ncbi:basic salivary proline-rich protein 1-like [Moschus berezovskii]|uniref:basic salivary proline-rich protein 1-like n=1 Tax=Moschus berezovskii TaxID=68408 RepID=UPI0024440937|nr:basic salivary proline-rich protein 1-like [Moschus berezovskii]